MCLADDAAHSEMTETMSCEVDGGLRHRKAELGRSVESAVNVQHDHDT